MEKLCQSVVTLFVSLVLWGGVLILRPIRCQAEEPLIGVQTDDPVRAKYSGESPAKPAGHRRPCVLLSNDNLLFGKARQVGIHVIVETREGSEIKLDQNQVLCWAESPQHLYRYRVDHRQNDDVETLLRDVRWCIRYGLFDLAAYDLLAIRRLEPDHNDADLLEQQLRNRWNQHRLALQTVLAAQYKRDPAQTDSPVPRANESETLLDRQVNSIQGERNPITSGDAVVTNKASDENFHPTALRLFASHIQPMLVNRCGVCHASVASGSQNTGWQLLVPPSGSRASAIMTRENLIATMEFTDHAEPEQSRLYRMATQPHGGRTAGLTARNSAAIQSLSQWISGLNWQDPRSSRSKITNGLADSNSPNMEMDLHGDAKRKIGVGESLAVISSTIPDGVSTTGRMLPSRLPLVRNPFDPQLFNRRLHLRKSKSPIKANEESSAPFPK